MLAAHRPTPAHENTCEAALQARTTRRSRSPTDQAFQEGTSDKAAADLEWGLLQLDADRDGKVAEVDLDMLLELVYAGITAVNAPPSWRKLKESARRADGSLALSSLRMGLGRGEVQRDLIDMCKNSQAEGGDSTSNLRIRPFPSVRDYIRCFRSYDRDCNGVICKLDLRGSVHEKLGADLSKEQCTAVISRVDSDWDSAIGLNDFGALIQELAEIE